jgi:4'-phosphopantetheinyl transferase
MVFVAAVSDSRDLHDSLYDSLLAVVSDGRKQRAGTYLRREDACRSIAGEALAKYCVGRVSGVSPGTISFHADIFGKPHVEKIRGVHFNISHSGSWAVCAVDLAPVGIDVEHVRHRDLNVAKRFFHPNEYAALAALPEPRRTGRFFDLWTIKESYIKARGKGLSIPLDSFEIRFENDEILMDSSPEDPNMHFRQYDLGRDYRCAVCAGNAEFPGEIEIMTPATLVRKIGRKSRHCPPINL